MPCVNVEGAIHAPPYRGRHSTQQRVAMKQTLRPTAAMSYTHDGAQPSYNPSAASLTCTHRMRDALALRSRTLSARVLTNRCSRALERIHGGVANRMHPCCVPRLAPAAGKDAQIQIKGLSQRKPADRERAEGDVHCERVGAVQPWCDVGDASLS